jgi:hypothetical protein
MSFKMKSAYAGITIPEAVYKIIERNAHDGEQRGRMVLAMFPTEKDKDKYTNVLPGEAWDIQAEAQTDESGAEISPAYVAIFGKYADGTQMDARAQMYKWIRSLERYKDATDC